MLFIITNSIQFKDIIEDMNTVIICVSLRAAAQLRQTFYAMTT